MKLIVIHFFLVDVLFFVGVILDLDTDFSLGRHVLLERLSEIIVVLQLGKYGIYRLSGNVTKTHPIAHFPSLGEKCLVLHNFSNENSKTTDQFEMLHSWIGISSQLYSWGEISCIQ